MKCALTAQNLLSLQQLSFIYRPLIGRPCVNTQMVPAHERTHQQATDPSPRSIFYSPSPPQWMRHVRALVQALQKLIASNDLSCFSPWSVFLMWHPVLSPIQKLAFAMDISHAGADSVSITAEEHSSTSWSTWLDPAPHTDTAEEAKFWTFISLWCLLDFKLLRTNLSVDQILVSSVMLDNKLSTGYKYFPVEASLKILLST